MSFEIYFDELNKFEKKSNYYIEKLENFEINGNIC